MQLLVAPPLGNMPRSRLMARPPLPRHHPQPPDPVTPAGKAHPSAVLFARGARAWLVKGEGRCCPDAVVLAGRAGFRLRRRRRRWGEEKERRQWPVEGARPYSLTPRHGGEGGFLSTQE